MKGDKQMLSIQKEIRGLWAALTADIPNEYAAESRVIFLDRWFRSKVGCHLGRTSALYDVAQAVDLSTREIWRWKGFVYGER